MIIKFQRNLLSDDRVRDCEACGLKAFFYFDMFDNSTWAGFTYVCTDNKCFEYLKLKYC